MLEHPNRYSGQQQRAYQVGKGSRLRHHQLFVTLERKVSERFIYTERVGLRLRFRLTCMLADTQKDLSKDADLLCKILSKVMFGPSSI